MAQLVALFSRFEPENGPRVVYRLLTGRMKGQAFITLPGEGLFHTYVQPGTAGHDAQSPEAVHFLLYCTLHIRSVIGCNYFPLADAETAQKALVLVHGYRLLGKPLVVEFGRERQEEEKQKEKEVQEEKK